MHEEVPFAAVAAIRTRSRSESGGLYVARIPLIRGLGEADERKREETKGTRERRADREEERPKLVRSKQRVAGDRVNKGPRILLATVYPPPTETIK